MDYLLSKIINRSKNIAENMQSAAGSCVEISESASEVKSEFCGFFLFKIQMNKMKLVINLILCDITHMLLNIFFANENVVTLAPDQNVYVIFVFC